MAEGFEEGRGTGEAGAGGVHAGEEGIHLPHDSALLWQGGDQAWSLANGGITRCWILATGLFRSNGIQKAIRKHLEEKESRFNGPVASHYSETCRAEICLGFPRDEGDIAEVSTHIRKEDIIRLNGSLSPRRGIPAKKLLWLSDRERAIINGTYIHIHELPIGFGLWIEVGNYL